MSTLEHELIKTLIKYNRVQAQKATHDPGAMTKYVIRLERVLAAMENGMLPAAALGASFSGPLFDALQKAVERTGTHRPRLHTVA